MKVLILFDVTPKEKFERYMQAGLEELGTKIAQLRGGMKQSALAATLKQLDETDETLYVSRQAISLIENGKANFKIKKLFALAYVLDVSIAALWAGRPVSEKSRGKYGLFHDQLDRVLQSDNKRAFDLVMSGLAGAIQLLDSTSDKES